MNSLAIASSAKRRSSLSDRLSARWFDLVHRTQLIYNTCWEDPRLDREALRLDGNHTVVTITSAGCNVLDYALLQPRRIVAVDMNPHQNALLELKLAAIRQFDFEEFFSLFGWGRLPDFSARYAAHLRALLSPAAQNYWDRHLAFFAGSGSRPTFYFHGATGVFAWFINQYIDRVARIREDIDAALAVPSLEQQRDIYFRRLRPAFWGRFVRWLIRRDVSLSLLGVPRSQREQIDREYPGGVAAFVESSLQAVFAELPLSDNYFWRVYLTGSYTRECCPAYLRRENFLRLKAGLIDRIEVRTCSVTQFLRIHQEPVDRFVLLDHMDWMIDRAPSQLAAEWQAIADRAAPGARLIWRSAGVQRTAVDAVRLQVGGSSTTVGDWLRYDDDLAAELHRRDRVHTYGSFHVAEATS